MPRNAVESLGEILDEGSAGERRQVTDTLSTDPIVLDHPGRRDVDLVIDDDTMSRLDELTDDALDGAQKGIEEIELVISAQRRSVHHAEALLAAELAERYRSGTISSDELITGSAVRAATVRSGLVESTHEWFGAAVTSGGDVIEA